MNDYQAKLDAKRERLENAADRAERKANATFEQADLREEKSGIPLGQPILVGHHSEGRHRRALERADNAMRTSVEQSKRAGELRARAESVGTGGINAQDPEAITKLREKLADLETAQRNMKDANRIVRKWSKKGVTHETQDGLFIDYAAQLGAVADHFTDALARKMLEPHYGRVVAFESYQLTNNNAKIKATKERLASLEAMQDSAPVREKIEGVCVYVENPDLARVQLFFEGKPADAVRAILKSNGFRWAPSETAWQRHLNNRGRFAAKQVIRQIQELSQ